MADFARKLKRFSSNTIMKVRENVLLLIATTVGICLAFKLGDSEATNNTIVDLGYSKYEGSFNSLNGVTTFLGIRYAAAPIGKFIQITEVGKVLTEF
jgi:hypothetical protein